METRYFVDYKLHNVEINKIGISGRKENYGKKILYKNR